MYFLYLDYALCFDSKSKLLLIKSVLETQLTNSYASLYLYLYSDAARPPLM